MLNEDVRYLSRSSSVSVVTNVGVGQNGDGASSPGNVKAFPLRLGFQTGSVAYPAVYSLHIAGFFVGSKVVMMCSYPLSSISRRVEECLELYLHLPHVFIA
jgi:hypothetical protein